MRVVAAAAIVIAVTAPAVATADVPVVVAVDTSRSLTPTELMTTVEALAGSLERMPTETPVGLVAFDDAPRWVVPLGAPPAEVAARLGDLRPQGDYTLLNDALFRAIRELESGGVVLVATDGRDENSATTVEDIARLAEEQRVRIVAVGSGAPLDERALRRLTLLTNGEYLGGSADEAGGTRIADALVTASEAVAAETVAEVPPEAGPAAGAPTEDSQEVRSEAATEPVDTRVEPTEPADDEAPWWSSPLIWFVIAALAALAMVGWVAVRRRRRHPSFCRRCGTPLPAPGVDCPRCEAEEAQDRLRDRPVASLEDTGSFTIDPEVVAAESGPEALEKTRVLVDQSVLVAHLPGEEPTTYLLRAEKAFAIGRNEHDNTLAIPDPALSGQHLKVVPDDGGYYVVDLDSTNGTFVNQDRVQASRLTSGDVIHAGQSEFEFRSYSTPAG